MKKIDISQMEKIHAGDNHRCMVYGDIATVCFAWGFAFSVFFGGTVAAVIAAANYGCFD